MRSASRRRNATINGLANLTDDYKIINISHTQGPENIFPGRRERSDSRAEQTRHLWPSVAKIFGAVSSAWTHRPPRFDACHSRRFNRIDSPRCWRVCGDFLELAEFCRLANS